MSQAAAVPALLERRIGGAVVRLVEGDLTALPVDAVVHYAREDLVLGSGYGTAIQSRGGDSIKKELAAIGGIRAGEAVITGAGKLKARHIIHACGPKFQSPQTAEKLGGSMLSALSMAGAREFESIAFPPMGAGFYGVPLDLCASVMLVSIQRALAEGGSLKEVVICVTDRREFAAFRREMEKL